MFKIKSFCHYWRENINTAREGYDMIVLIVFLVWQAFFLICKFYGLEAQIFGANESAILDDINGTFAFLFIVWGLLWLPFKRHEAEQTKIAAKSQKPIEKLNKDLLGLHLKRLEFRIYALQKMDVADYTATLDAGFDEESMSLIAEINTFIISNYGHSESALFESRLEIGHSDDNISRSEPSDASLKKYMEGRLKRYAANLLNIIQTIANKGENKS
jgi:hypothetical protein